MVDEVFYLTIHPDFCFDLLRWCICAGILFTSLPVRITNLQFLLQIPVFFPHQKGIYDIALKAA